MAAYGSGLELARDTLPEVRTHLELWPEELADNGSLRDTPFALLLARARLSRVTGVLGLRGERFVYLSRGLPVYVDSVLSGDASEVHLVQAGLLRDRALEATRAAAFEQGTGVGEALLRMGVISASELFEHKRQHTRQRLVDCMGWRDGTARFERRSPFGAEIIPIPIDLAQVLADGVATHYDARRLARELPVTEAHRVYLAGPPDAARNLTLGTLETLALQRAGARPSLAALAVELRTDPVRLHAALFVLYHLSLVGFELAGEAVREAAREVHPADAEVVRPRMPAPRPAPAVARPPHATPAPTAARPPHPTPAPVRVPTPAPMAPPAAPAVARPPRPTPAPARVPTPRPMAPPAAPAVARPPHPTPAPAMPDEGEDEPAPRAGRPGAGRRALPPLGRPTRSAAGYLEDAERERDAGNLEGALEALRYAHVVEPQNAAITAELALALLGADERAFARDAGRLARDARRINPNLPLPYVVLGMLMEQLRDGARAAQLYRYALARDPGCEQARTRLEQIEARRRR